MCYLLIDRLMMRGPHQKEVSSGNSRKHGRRRTLSVIVNLRRLVCLSVYTPAVAVALLLFTIHLFTHLSMCVGPPPSPSHSWSSCYPPIDSFVYLCRQYFKIFGFASSDTHTHTHTHAHTDTHAYNNILTLTHMLPTQCHHRAKSTHIRPIMTVSTTHDAQI